MGGPGSSVLNWSVSAGAILMGLWLGSYVFGLVSPALEPSMLGKRHYCVWETFAYGLPPMLLGFVLAWYLIKHTQGPDKLFPPAIALCVPGEPCIMLPPT